MALECGSCPHSMWMNRSRATGSLLIKSSMYVAFIMMLMDASVIAGTRVEQAAAAAYSTPTPPTSPTLLLQKLVSLVSNDSVTSPPSASSVTSSMRETVTPNSNLLPTSPMDLPLVAQINFTSTLFNLSEVSEIINEYFVNDRIFDPFTEIAAIAIYSILMMTGFSSNVIIILCILSNPKMLTPSNLLLLNLNVSDLALCLVCMPFTLVGILRRSWSLGSFLCKLVPFVQGVSIFVSAGTVSAIALDRLVRITCTTHRYSQRTQMRRQRYRTILQTLAIWFIAIVLSLPIAFYQEVRDVGIPGLVTYPKCIELWPTNYRGSYTIIILIAQLILPTIVLSLVHFRIKGFLNRSHMADVPMFLSTSASILSSTQNLNRGSAISTPMSKRPRCDTAATWRSECTIQSEPDDKTPRHKHHGTRRTSSDPVDRIDVAQSREGDDQTDGRAMSVDEQPQGKGGNGMTPLCRHLKSLMETQLEKQFGRSLRRVRSGPESEQVNNLPAIRISNSNEELRRASTISTDEEEPKDDTNSQGGPGHSLAATPIRERGLGDRIRSYHLNHIQEHNRRISRAIKRNDHATMVLMNVSILFAVSWLPWNLFNFYADFFAKDDMGLDSKQLYLWFAICHVVAMSSATSNSILYGWLNTNIRRELIGMRAKFGRILREGCWPNVGQTWEPGDSPQSQGLGSRLRYHMGRSVSFTGLWGTWTRGSNEIDEDLGSRHDQPFNQITIDQPIKNNQRSSPADLPSRKDSVRRKRRQLHLPLKPDFELNGTQV